jgi:hypothetical protein
LAGTCFSQCGDVFQYRNAPEEAAIPAHASRPMPFG